MAESIGSTLTKTIEPVCVSLASKGQSIKYKTAFKSLKNVAIVDENRLQTSKYQFNFKIKNVL